MCKLIRVDLQLGDEAVADQGRPQRGEVEFGIRIASVCSAIFLERRRERPRVLDANLVERQSVERIEQEQRSKKDDAKMATQPMARTSLCMAGFAAVLFYVAPSRMH